MDNEHNFFCCKNCILRVPRNILAKIFFEEKVFFFISFVFWANIFSFLSEYFEQDCRNWNLHVDKKFLKKIKFFEKIVGVFVFFTEMSEKFSTFWRKLFGRVVNTAFDVGIGWFWEVLFAHWANPFRHSVEDFPLGMSEKRSKFLIISLHWAKNFRRFVKKIEAGLPELLSSCLQEQFERLCFLEKILNFFFLFRTLSKNILAFVDFFQWGCH